MASSSQHDFNRSALTVRSKRAWYTGQQAEKIPNGLLGMVGADCVSLDLSYNNLASISALRDFAKIEELILDNNNLRDLRTLPVIQSLTTLSVNNNKLFNVEDCLDRIRECCPNVRYVSLLGNPGCPDQLTNPTFTDEADYERYRRYAIHALPQSLCFLDSRPVTSRERLEARDRGRFFRTIRIALKPTNQGQLQSDIQVAEEVILDDHYTPLPRTSRNSQDHKGAYGRCRYRYSGKNSEGNRFISNSDL